MSINRTIEQFFLFSCFAINMKINIINLPLYYQIQNKNTTKKSQTSFGCDTVSFSRKISDIPEYERHGGWCELFYKREEIEKQAVQNVPLLKNKTFGIEEYEKLTEKEKDYLRNIIDLPYLKYADRSNKERTIENDMLFFVKTSYKLKNMLDAKYPNGWSFVAIGGSTALYAKILEYMGADTKILPYSKNVHYKPNYKDINFNSYFDDVGLKKSYLNNGKTIIFGDYVSTGETIETIKWQLESTDRINRHEIFANFIDLFWDTLSSDEKNLLDDWFLNRQQIKSYTPCPNMNEISQYKNAINMNKNFEWNFTTKLMNFAVIDCIYEWKRNGWL